MDGKLHRLMFDLYLRLHYILFRTCPTCKEQVQRYLMNGTPIDQCSVCMTQDLIDRQMKTVDDSIRAVPGLEEIGDEG